MPFGALRPGDTVKKKYRLTLDLEVDIDDLEKLPLSREGWRGSTPGEFIIENMAAVRRIFEKLMDDPETLDDYLQHHLVTELAEGFTPKIIEQISQQLGVELNCEAVIAPVVAKLEGAAARHLTEAQRRMRPSLPSISSGEPSMSGWWM